MKIDKWVEETDAGNALTVGKAAEWYLTSLGTRTTTWERGPCKCPEHRVSFSWVCVSCMPERPTCKSSTENRINSFCAQIAIGLLIGAPSKCSLDSTVYIFRKDIIYL